MSKSLIAIVFLAFALSSCDKPQSSTSSTKTLRLLDANMADEIQKAKEQSMEEVNMFDSRSVELMHVINDLYLSAEANSREEYQEVLSAHMELIQAKSHYEMERNMFVDKVLNQIANAHDKDELKKSLMGLIDEQKQQGELYMNAGRRLLDALNNAGIDNPLIDEMMAPAAGAENRPMEGEAAPPAGAAH